MSQVQPKSELKVVLGCMLFGEEGKLGSRIHDIKTIEEILDTFQAHGHTELDTARAYGLGTSEEFLTEAGWQKRGLLIDTKLFPTKDLRRYLDISLKALNTDCLDMWYLHAPDRTTPYDITLKGVNDLYKEGKFKRFGISNYKSWEVAEIVGICKSNGYVVPSVYQGIYNPVHRKVEPELFPCLRKYGISFYQYSPLGGGFFTGRYRSLEDKPEQGSRFDSTHAAGQAYRKRYWNDAHFKALGLVETVAEKHNLTLAEIALRWASHHSQMKKEYGDAVIVGGSSTKHIKQNLLDLEKGPLPEEVVQVLDEAWLSCNAKRIDLE
ncbi:Aldo/keto reductase [Cytidiella melzeri]|nr:Aldo/keto reductase [Cytidiella melzeri]